MKSIWKLAIFGGFALFLPCTAQAQQDGCAHMDDPATRLACYDRRFGRPVQDSPPTVASAPSAAALAPPIGSYQDRRDVLKRRTGFDSRLRAAIPLRHGYHRLELEDGTAYDMTTVAPPPAVGTAIYVRRTAFGTTFFDIEGRKSLSVRLSRRQ
ncbi:hypothetical protein [Sphingobium sp.]|uniref:hypothetical protein n=1 Tax=Sphingobium sp. TaxID=1912891 RepID=UPI0035C76553